jgi:DNA repair exonuclease SbcCD ATPase subunit
MKIEFTDFQAFEGSHELHLDDQTCYLLHGKNLDEGGSNGSGKTSLMTAIALAFTGEAPKNITKKELPFSGKNNFQLSLSYGDFKSTFGDHVVINGQEMGKSKFNQDFQSLLGFTKDQFNTVCYIYQNSKNRFMDLSDSEKKDFLFPLMNWDSIFVGLEQANSDKKALPDTSINQEAIVALEGRRQSALSAAADLAMKKELALSKLKQEVEIARNEAQTMDATLIRHQEELLSLKKSLADKLRSDKNRLDEMKDKLKLVDLKKQELIKLELQISQLSNTIAALRNPNTKCPTCGSDMHKDHSVAIKEHLAALEDKQLQQKAVKDFLQGSEELHELATNLELQIRTEIINGTQQKETEVAGLSTLSDQLKKNLANIERHYKEQSQSFEREESSLKLAIDTIDKDIFANKKTIEEINLKSIQLTEIIDILKKVQSIAIDMAMRDLVEISNIWLSPMSGGALSIDFETTKVQGNKKVAQKIVPVINHKVRGPVSVGSLSGGEYAKCRLAVDMALHEIVTARVNTIPKVLMLDEVTHDIDAEGKIAFYNLITQRLSDRFVLIAEHHEEIKGMFSNIIVEKKDGRARVINNE